MSTARNIDGVKNRRPPKPSPELLPFLDALAELLAKQVVRELRDPCAQTEAISTVLTSGDITKLHVEEFPLNGHSESEQ